MNINGVLAVKKEKGMTSHTVVSKVRRIIEMKKVGHCGTLDPNATGVLPILLGSGTKLSEFLSNYDKEYIASVKFGYKSDTLDIWGDITKVSGQLVTKENLLHTITKLIGEIDQVPPMYSAIKIGGKKLYQLAREGKEIDRAKRKIKIYDIQLIDFDFHNQSCNIRVLCSKGTYIRTLCQDIAIALSTNAVMSDLIRTKGSGINIENCITLDKLEDIVQSGNIGDFLIEVPDFFDDYQKINVNGFAAHLLLNGQKIQYSKYFKGSIKEGMIRIYTDKGFYGIGEVTNGQDGELYVKSKIKFC